MPGNYSLVKTVITGETITAADRNAEHQNHITNCDPDGVGDASADVAEMQATTDPYPGSSESLATSLRGELQRLRFVIKQITGKAQWYIDPDTTIAALAATFFPATTEMVFFQAAAPTGWTQNTTHTNKGLRVVDGSGGGSGGTLAFDSATVANHTLVISEMPAHTHTTNINDPGAAASLPLTNAPGAGDEITTDSTGGDGAHNHGLDLQYIDVIVAAKD
jgi:hypothetical protein